MPELTFAVEGADVVLFAAAPQLGFRLKVTNDDLAEVIHTVVLRCQIQIDVTRRHYGKDEEALLHDLFGDPTRWSQTLRTLLWTHTSVVVPPFSGQAEVSLLVPCTWDLNVAATKYFHALFDGEVPLTFLFSGSVFYESGAGALQVAPISWAAEAQFRLPISTWTGLIDTYYPNTAWLTLRRDVFDRLYRYKVRRGIPTWEQAIESILPEEREALQA